MKLWRARPLIRPSAARFLGLVVSLYCTQFASFILPALTIPFLARTLTLPSWGQLAFAQSFAAFAAIFIEYGFAFSGPQQAAEAGSDSRKRLRILSSVQAGKLLLIPVVAAICCLIRPYLPFLAISGKLFWSSLLCAAGQALSVTWFFLAIERVAVATTIDIVLKALAAVTIFVAIHGPDDAWKVLAIQAASSFLSIAACMMFAAREAPLLWPSWREITASLSHGRDAMLFRFSESIYTSGSPLLLGLLANSQAVGLYAGAEKICRGIMLPLLDPIQRSLYARITNTISSSREKAKLVAQKGAIWCGLIAMTMSAAFFLAAPLVIRVALGREFSAAANLLRVLCLVPPAVALKWSIGIHWMMPAGMQRQFSTIVLASSVLYIGLAIWLVWTIGTIGMAVTAAVVEFAIPLVCYFSVKNSRPTSFSRQHVLIQAASGQEVQ